MIASILLLVPGVPFVNAQSDILEGHPTLGSARAVSVAVLLIFVAVGLWFAQVFTGAASQVLPGATPARLTLVILHHTIHSHAAPARAGLALMGLSRNDSSDGRARPTG